MGDIETLRLELDALDKQRRDAELRIRDMRPAGRGGRQGNAHPGKRRGEASDHASKRRRSDAEEEDYDR